MICHDNGGSIARMNGFFSFRRCTAIVLVAAFSLLQLPATDADVQTMPRHYVAITPHVHGPLPITGGADAAWKGGPGGSSAAVAELQLRQFPLGLSLREAVKRLGTPWHVVYQDAKVSYWLYRTD